MKLIGAVALAALALTLVGVGSAVASSGAAVQTATGSTTYNATFVETGLPSGTSWGVHVSYIGCSCTGVHKTFTTTSSSITVPLMNGSYRYHAVLVPGFYVNVSASGILNISGASPANTSFVYHPVIPFPVEFNETGLPNATLWSVSVQGNGQGQERRLERVTETSYTDQVVFSLPNGTYHYTVAPIAGSFFLSPPKGKFVIDGASPPPVAVTFETPPTYNLTFTEHGLPNGTNWTVRIGGAPTVHFHQVLSTVTDQITFRVPAGTFHYVVGEVLGFTVNGSATGSITVTNTSVSANVTYQSLAPGAFYPVVFQENGLPNGTHWTVRIAATHTVGHSRGEAESSNSTTNTFSLQNGSYRFFVHFVRGFNDSVSSGSFSVAGGSPATIEINFTLIPTYTVTFSETGLPNGTNWSVLVRTQVGGWSEYPVRVTTTSNATSFTVSLPNGAYCYRLVHVVGYHLVAGKAKAQLTVSNGSPPGISFSFAPNL